MYTTTYGQPAFQEPPYPDNQLLFAPIQIVYGSPPILPQIAYVPPELAQYYPMIVSACMDAIQAKCSQNTLRVFLFNQMAQNGYNNPEFTAYVDAVVKIVEMQLYKLQYRDISQSSQKAAELYAELSVAANTQRFPGLLRNVDQSVIPHIQSALRDLGMLGQDIMQFQQSRGRGVPQNQPQPQYQNQYSNPYQPPQQQFAQPGFNRWPAPAPTAQFDGGAVGARSASVGYNQSQSLDPVYGKSIDPIAQRFENSERMRQASSSTHAQNIQDLRREKEAAILGNVPKPVGVQSVAKNELPSEYVDVYKASEAPVKWQPSEQFPVIPAYDPNTADLYFQVDNTGKIKPLVKKKEQTEMDIEKHLIVPSYVKPAPAAVKSLDSDVRVFQTLEAANAQAKTAAEAEPLELNSAYKDSAFYSETSLDQLWFNNEVTLATMKRSGKKANVFRSCGVLLDPLVCVINPKPMIVDFAQAEDFSQLCRKMKSVQDEINAGTYKDGDAKSLTFINRRLTKYLNDFLKHCLAVPNGWVDSFMEDANDVIPYLEKRYGTKFSEAMRSRQKALITQVLSYGDAAFEKDQNSNLFPFTDVDVELLLGTVVITYFYNNYTLTSLDLFAHELKAEVPAEGEVSCGIFNAQTPTLRQIVENIFTHERALKVEFSKHLIQTADKIVIEVTKSPIQEDFYLMAAG